MKYIFLIVIFSTSLITFAQTQSGNTENGEGTYLYSNGATYTGTWKDGKRHGKGKITYPKGASEANTKKEVIDTTCICSAWTPEASVTTEEKLWSDIETNKMNLIISELDVIEYYTDYEGKNLAKTKFSPGHFMNAYSVIDLIIAGDYKKAAEKASDWGLGTAFPAIAAYKGLLEASALTAKIIIENWMNDLYLMPIYQKVEDLMVNEINKGDKDFNAYVFSGYVRGNPGLRKKMAAREEIMFYRWNEIFENDMYISKPRAGQGENSFARLLYKMQERYPKGTAITNQMIFNEMMWIAAEAHKKQMLSIFQYEMEIRAEEQAVKLRRSMIKAVCENMLQTNKKSN